MWSLLRIKIAVIALCAAAQLSFDLNLADQIVPITGQTLAVLCCALLLPTWEATVAILIYFVMGGLGLPVFANGASGWSKFTGNSAGYFLGFLLATIAVGSTRGYKDHQNFTYIFQQQILGTIIILICGVSVLAYHIGLSSAIELGLAPFWLAAIVKIILGTIIVVFIRKLLRG